jgi:hypothetical protein
MKSGIVGFIMLCIFVAVLGCRRAVPDWNGTWTLIAAKSTTPTINIAISAQGEYRYDDGEVTTFFWCDGKYHQAGSNRTQACIKNGATSLDRIRRENGVKTNEYHWELSKSGQVLTFTATAFSSARPVNMGSVVLSRISGFNGFAGRWRDETFLQSRAQLVLRSDGQSLYIGYPAAGYFVDVPLDGSTSVVREHSGAMETSYSLIQTGPHEFRILAEPRGETVKQDLLQLSDDGRLLTDYSSDLGKLAIRAKLVYGKK